MQITGAIMPSSLSATGLRRRVRAGSPKANLPRAPQRGNEPPRPGDTSEQQWYDERYRDEATRDAIREGRTNPPPTEDVVRGLRDLANQRFDPVGGWPEDRAANDDFARRLEQMLPPGRRSTLSEQEPQGPGMQPGETPYDWRRRMGEFPPADEFLPHEAPGSPVERGNWLWGNDQSLLSYHPLLDPRTWLGVGPTPQSMSAGLIPATSLLDLVRLAAFA